MTGSSEFKYRSGEVRPENRRRSVSDFNGRSDPTTEPQTPSREPRSVKLDVTSDPSTESTLQTVEQTYERGTQLKVAPSSPESSYSTQGDGASQIGLM
uniref:Uncharacterized protein n=1 Tax=Timema genevievae TaxID=629358 RepID=A0A7R9JR66_TIMGE|nr:unnamed protein product [Timema genevievae]